MATAVLLSAFEEADVVRAHLDTAPGVTGDLRRSHDVGGLPVFILTPDNPNYPRLYGSGRDFELLEVGE